MRNILLSIYLNCVSGLGDDLHGVTLVLHQVDVSRLQLGDPPLQLLNPGIF